jgi:hypothetical protein
MSITRSISTHQHRGAAHHLGYSLNDTVVIYDRIREMLRRYKCR